MPIGTVSFFYPSRTLCPFPSRSSRSGFTLVEVLVGILLIGSALAMSAVLLTSGGETAQSARDLTAATLVARTQLGQLDQVASSAFPQSGQTVQGNTTFDWAANVQSVEPGLERIQLEIKWKSGKIENQKEFTCLRTR